MLSVLIVNWNTREALAACLRSIERHPPLRPYETIVVDNASRDGSADAVERGFPWVKLLRAPRNLGYAKGNNLAFATAQGELLLTLNPDTELLDDSLERACESLERHPAHGALAPRLIGPDGATQRSVRGFPTVAGIFGELAELWRLFPRSPFASYRLPTFDYDRLQDAPQPMGTFLLFRRDALESVGDSKAPFDPAFPIFFNEVDLLFRMHQAGWPCLYDPEVRVRHLGGESTRQVRPQMIWESHRSLVRYLAKHRLVRGGPLARGLLALLLYAAAFVRARGYYGGFGAHGHDL
ncbi:MAG: glycosyltransferase family 2 protein [Fimbriimonadales bacterium]|nr:glycosyltransferase family 2 protein [Fimbriimonadales bacterium]